MPQVYVRDVELSGIPAGGSARVVRVDLDDGVRVRLRELGLRPGGELHVTHRAAFGGLVVAVGADRFALDARTVARIHVEQAPGSRAARAAGSGVAS